MNDTRPKRAFFWMLRNTVNKVALRAARSGRGPFALLRHVGRRTGRTYETPLILAPVPGGFVAELTYGANVAWYRNLLAAGHAVVLFSGAEYQIDGVEPCATDAGRRAFGAKRVILILLRRKEFRLLRVAST